MVSEEPSSFVLIPVVLSSGTFVGFTAKTKHLLKDNSVRLESCNTVEQQLSIRSDNVVGEFHLSLQSKFNPVYSFQYKIINSKTWMYV